MKTRRHVLGLTLLELVIGLAVLGILATLALPDVGRRIERGRVHSAAQALAADIAEARFEAARRGQSLFVQARPGADWCWAVASSAGCDCSLAQACQVHTVKGSGYRGVRLVDGLSLRMERNGAAQAVPQAAVLETSRGEQLRVEISPLGRARVCARAGTWPSVPVC